VRSCVGVAECTTVLADGDFVSQVLNEAEEELSRKKTLKTEGWDLPRLVKEVCSLLTVDPENLQKKGRVNSLYMAKGVICYLGYSQLGINGDDLARFFNISKPTISKAIRRGEKYVKENEVQLLS